MGGAGGGWVSGRDSRACVPACRCSDVIIFGGAVSPANPVTEAERTRELVTSAPSGGVVKICEKQIQRSDALRQAKIWGRVASTNPLVVVDELLDNDVAPLNVHDGGDRLFGRTQQCRTETHAEIRHRHQVFVGVT